MMDDQCMCILRAAAEMSRAHHHSNVAQDTKSTSQNEKHLESRANRVERGDERLVFASRAVLGDGPHGRGSLSPLSVHQPKWVRPLTLVFSITWLHASFQMLQLILRVFLASCQTISQLVWWVGT